MDVVPLQGLATGSQQRVCDTCVSWHFIGNDKESNFFQLQVRIVVFVLRCRQHFWGTT